MSEDIGKRGLRVFVDWVENGQDWDDEEGAHGAAEGAHAAGQAKKESVKRNMGRRFTEYTQEHALRVFGSIYRAVAQVVCLAGMAVLLMMVSHLPAFGSADNPANNEVAGRYLEDGLSETGAVNTVAGIILDYRAFDTSCAVNPEAGPAGGQTREGEGNAKGMRKGISYWNRWPGCWFPSFSYLACMWCSTVICPPEAGSQEGRLWGLV